MRHFPSVYWRNSSRILLDIEACSLPAERIPSRSKGPSRGNVVLMRTKRGYFETMILQMSRLGALGGQAQFLP